MSVAVFTLSIINQRSVVVVRQRARELATLCGFAKQDQIRIATAVSELARNIVVYAGSGKARFEIDVDATPQSLVVVLEDQGPGIAHLEEVLSGQYRSPSGLGLGISGSRRLMDAFDIDAAAGSGTSIRMSKHFPAMQTRLSREAAIGLTARLSNSAEDDAFSEVLRQNNELLATLTELRARQTELLQVTKELEDTNLGVVALYAELDEKAERLRHAGEMKSRFLANMSHEFRTPVSSISAIARLLHERTDGELTEEQDRQVNLILEGARGLDELVNGLLDIARIESGRIQANQTTFLVDDLLNALRGTLGPLLDNTAVNLVFKKVDPALELHTDEAKLSQILRNFIANALKFTQQGEIVVSVSHLVEQNELIFSVKDTGIGISQQNINLIFEEFTQIEHPLQRTFKGTGLGLSLCRSLATLLKGHIGVSSEEGRGSEFTLTLPMTPLRRLQQETPEEESDASPFFRQQSSLSDGAKQ